MAIIFLLGLDLFACTNAISLPNQMSPARAYLNYICARSPRGTNRGRVGSPNNLSPDSLPKAHSLRVHIEFTGDSHLRLVETVPVHEQGGSEG